jgi:RNA processing factor Prp31
MFNLDSIKEFAQDIKGKAEKTYTKYAPEVLSPEKQYINSLAITAVLCTMADKKAEEQEVKDSIEFLSEVEEVVKNDMVTDAIEFYELHLEELTKVVDSPAKWTIKVAKLLQDIKVTTNEQKIMIESIMDHLLSLGDVTNEEQAMKDKILFALSK